MPTAANAGLIAVVASAPCMGEAENDPNLSGLSPPCPSQFIQPFLLAWQEGFHVITAGLKVGIMAHWFISSNITPDVFWLLTMWPIGQSLKMPSAVSTHATRRWPHLLWLSSTIAYAMPLALFNCTQPVPYPESHLSALVTVPTRRGNALCTIQGEVHVLLWPSSSSPFCHAHQLGFNLCRDWVLAYLSPQQPSCWQFPASWPNHWFLSPNHLLCGFWFRWPWLFHCTSSSSAS